MSGANTHDGEPIGELERTVLVTLCCAGDKTHVLARVVDESGSLFIEAPHLRGGYWPNAVNAHGQRFRVLKGAPGRYELQSGDAALRSATRFSCSCTNMLVSDVVFVNAIAEGKKKLISDQVPEAVLRLDGHDFSNEILRFVLSDSPHEP